MEYQYDVNVFNDYKQDFKKMTLGLPLMYWMGQENQRDDVQQALKALSTQFPKLQKTKPYSSCVMVRQILLMLTMLLSKTV